MQTPHIKQDPTVSARIDAQMEAEILDYACRMAEQFGTSVKRSDAVRSLLRLGIEAAKKR